MRELQSKRMRALFGALSAGVLSFAHVSHVDAQPAKSKEPAQLVVLADLGKCTIEHSFHRGDRVVELRLENPPPGALEALAAQTGRVVDRVRRISHVGNVLTVQLHLRSKNVEILPPLKTVPRRKKPGVRPWSIAFAESDAADHVDVRTLIGHVRGDFETPRHPVLYPPLPSSSPCPRDPTACDDYTIAQRVAALNDAVYPEDAHRWAYRFRRDQKWTGYPAAYAFTALTAAHVLGQARMFPEAASVLDRQSAPSPYSPWINLARAQLAAATGDLGAAAQGFEALQDPATPSDVQGAAMIGRILVAEDEGKPEVLLRLVTAVRARAPQTVTAELLLMGGEAALDLRRLDVAREFYQAAAERSPNGRDARVSLRLVDLDVQTKPIDREKLLAAYTAITTRDPCVADMLRVRRIVMTEQRAFALLIGLESQRTHAACPTSALEAMFAEARIEMSMGEQSRALRRVEEIHGLIGESVKADAALRNLVGAVVGDLVAKLARHRSWRTLANLRETRLGRFSDSIDADRIEDIARAYAEVGAPSEAAALLVGLIETPERKNADRITASLTKAYFEAKDSYRADLVARFFMQRHKSSSFRWSVEQVTARLALEEGRPDVALEILDGAASITPAADPTIRAQALRATALVALKRPGEASVALLRVLDSPLSRLADEGGLAVRVVSECARTCTPEELAPLLMAAAKHDGERLLNDRVRWQLAKREVPCPARSSQTETDPLWQQMRALGEKPQTN